MVTAERELIAPDLESYRGRWVAIKDGKVIASAESAVDLVRELNERKVRGAALHRVSEHPNAALVL